MPTDSAARIPFSGTASITEPRQRLIVALDVSTVADAQRIVTAVGDSALTYKVGMQLYTAEGPSVVRDLVASGRRVFLDLKYHDIPNTVGAAVREAAQLGVSMLTVHAFGAGRMLRAAVEAGSSAPEMMILAVTVLTSMDDQELAAIGIADNTGDQVSRLAKLAISQGCHGIVASPQEGSRLRSKYARRTECEEV